MQVSPLPFKLLERVAPEPARDEHGEIIYPETDGLPMAWNTVHYDLLTLAKSGLEQYYAARPDVFVAGDLFWYPVAGHPEIVVAPDVFVAFGRPKGARRSYKQWEEGGVAPQVVIEIISDERITGRETVWKLDFYQRHGVREYIVFEPEEPTLLVWVREGEAFRAVPDPQGWKSPLLDLTFWITHDGTLKIVLPDGSVMLSYAEQAQRAELEKQRAEQEKQRADKLAERLRAMGVDPDAL